MRPFFLRTMILVAVAVAVACSGDDKPSGPTNNTADAGVTMDAATDMGIIDEDGGVGMDAAPDDMGTVDAGGMDAETMADAGTEDVGPDAGLDTTCDEAFFDNGGACGGDLDGTAWRFVGSCGDVDDALGAFLLDCPDTMVTVMSETSSGTITLNLNGTYMLDLEDTFQLLVDVDPVCAAEFDCIAQIQPVLGSGAVCFASECGCECELMRVDDDEEIGESYNTNNNQLSISINAILGPTRTFDYCVNQGVLRYREDMGSRTYILVED